MTLPPTEEGRASARDDMEDPDSVRITRLERRLERERAARRAAEAIAERGMRELWLANRELDRRMAERTRDLEQARREAEAAMRTRHEFLASLSHEMRTPLNGVIGMLELLLGNAGTDQDRSYLTSALRSAERLDRLFNRLFILVEIEGGRLHPKPEVTSPQEITDQLARTWRRPALAKGFLMTTECFFPEGTEVRVDATRLGEIVEEFIDNALGHAVPGSLALRVRPEDASIRVEVEDDGPGVDLAMVEQLFGVFSRGDSTPSGRVEGVGIGLALSRALAERLGGTVGLESTAHGGTLAWVSLPTLASPR